MKRVHVLSTVMAAAMSCGVVCERAQAQPEIEALLWFNGGGTSRNALNALKYTQERAVGEARFIEAMQRKSWDLVVWDLPYATILEPKTTLKLLEDHVAAGGRLLVNYNNLDTWPELQTLLGLDGALERLVPVEVRPLVPQHASFAGFGLGVQSNPYGDSGDTLVPSSESIVVGEFVNGGAAIVLSANSRTIVNGFDWDSYAVTSSFVQFQIEYIMACRADFDQSTGKGVLDIFDFLAFQNDFVHQVPAANMKYDKVFDIFDFLAFQEAFINSCK